MWKSRKGPDSSCFMGCSLTGERCQSLLTLNLCHHGDILILESWSKLVSRYQLFFISKLSISSKRGDSSNIVGCHFHKGPKFGHLQNFMVAWQFVRGMKRFIKAIHKYSLTLLSVWAAGNCFVNCHILIGVCNVNIEITLCFCCYKPDVGFIWKFHCKVWFCQNNVVYSSIGWRWGDKQ